MSGADRLAMAARHAVDVRATYGWGPEADAAICALESVLADQAAVPATGWTGNPDADLALMLLDCLDDTGEANACRIELLEGLVRALAAHPAPAQAPLSDELVQAAIKTWFTYESGRQDNHEARMEAALRVAAAAWGVKLA